MGLQSGKEAAQALMYILNSYVVTHDKVFRAPIFKAIPFHEYVKEMRKLLVQLRELSDSLPTTDSKVENDYLNVLRNEYIPALLDAMEEFEYLCIRLARKSEGEWYDILSYYIQTYKYQKAVNRYAALGDKLNKLYSKL